MTQPIRIALLILATLAFAAWVSLIGNQQSPALLVLAEVATLLLAAVVLRRPLSSKALWLLGATGAAVGLVGAIIAAAVNQIALRGFEQFLSRDFTQDLYFYPSVSLSWLYGAMVIALAFARPRQPS